MSDLEAIRVDALEAYKRAITWAFVCNYAGGPRTISHRTPDDHTFHLSTFFSFSYADVVGCSVPAARAHLRKLVRLGEVIEVTDRRLRPCRFIMPRAVHDQVGAEIIAELVAEGLPFDDDWRRAQQAHP
jgi:hypothetical protein